MIPSRFWWFTAPLHFRLAPVEVLTPQTLDEALALKRERRDAVPIQGGTDVMVDLNFDRARPDTILNLNEVAELRGWGRENSTLRLGSGLTYAEAMENGLASVLPALAEARWNRAAASISPAAPRRAGPAGPSAGPGGGRPPGATRCRRCSSTRPRSWLRRLTGECGWFRWHGF